MGEGGGMRQAKAAAETQGQEGSTLHAPTIGSRPLHPPPPPLTISKASRSSRHMSFSVVPRSRSTVSFQSSASCGGGKGGEGRGRGRSARGQPSIPFLQHLCSCTDTASHIATRPAADPALPIC